MPTTPLGSALPDPEMFAAFVAAGDGIVEHYHNKQYAHAIRTIMTLADQANQYIADHQPWALAKQEDIPQMTAVITQALNCYRLLVLYLSPIIPVTAAKSFAFMQAPLTWETRATPLLNHQIADYKHLLKRIDPTMCPQYEP